LNLGKEGGCHDKKERGEKGSYVSKPAGAGIIGPATHVPISRVGNIEKSRQRRSLALP